MNLFFIDKEFQKLKAHEEILTFKFEPRSNLNTGKRHIYYDDLKFDFVDEVNAYGFSPFIQSTFDVQRKDQNIMRYKNKKFNQGLINYVKKKNQKILLTKEKLLSKGVFPKRKTGMDNNSNDPFFQTQVEHFHRNSKKEKQNFLHKALEDLARNKLNISDEEDELFENEKKLEGEESIANLRKISEQNKEKEKQLNTLKENYLKSLHYKVDLNPLISFSDFDQPDALKMNFERFFSNVKVIRKNNKETDDIKKIVGLMKNKELVIKIRGSSAKVTTMKVTGESSFEKVKETERNSATELKSILKNSKSSVKNRNSRPVGTLVGFVSTRRKMSSMHPQEGPITIVNINANKKKQVDQDKDDIAKEIIEKAPNSLFSRSVLIKR